MKIQVKAVDSVNEKSKQELEREIIEDHAASQNDNQDNDQDNDQVGNQEGNQEGNQGAEDNIAQAEINEESVMSFIKEKYGKEIESIDSLFASEASPSNEIPEDISKFIQYRNETGRGMEDYMRLNENFDEMNDNSLLSRFYAETEDGWDQEDINGYIEDNFAYDEDLDEDSLIRKRQRDKKKEIVKAKKYFEGQKEKYYTPLESNGSSAPDDPEYLAFKEQMSNAKTQQEQAAKKAEWFKSKTDELFSNEFKGFEFSIDDKKFTYPIQEIDKVRESQKDISNFISKFLNDDGLMEDTTGYHRALSIAMNPEKYAKFFYEQGVSDTVSESAAEDKNITLGARRKPETQVVGKTTIRAVSDPSGRGLKFKK